MALTSASDLKYESMKLALKRISLNVRSNSENNEMNIKQEELLFTRQENNKFESKGKQKLNPLNKQGQTSRCAICDSKMYWVKHCLHRIKNNSANIAEISESEGEDTENVQITLITEKSELDNLFVAEMSCSAVIDTDCSKTVAEIDWFTNYTKNLDDYLLKQVLYKKPNTPFRFTDGRKVYSQNKAAIPAKIGKTPCKQFGHASIENMRPLLNNASLLNSETSKLIEKVYNSCKTYLIYKKPLHRQIVGLSKASNFNDTIAMDLH